MKNILLVFVHNNKEFLPKMSFFFLQVIYFNSNKNVNTAPRVKPVEGAFQASERPGFTPSTPKTKDSREDREGRAKLAGLYSHSRKCRSQASPGKHHAHTSRKRTCALVNLDHTTVESAVCRLTVKQSGQLNGGI